MSLFDGLSRIAKSRAQRRTENLLNALPLEVQKDIGWRWSSSRRDADASKFSDWTL